MTPRGLAHLTPAAEALLGGSPYRGYAYSYPHKTAYRPLDPVVPLADLWGTERRDALFLYLHVPFCEMRCGYCNLFTRAGAGAALVSRYLDALRRQAGRVRAALGPATFARFAIGGGTPTFLDIDGLATLLDVAGETMGADIESIGGSVEVSPGTVDAGKLGLLVSRGVDRVSIGVESFDDAEAAAVYRPQARAQVDRALALIRDSGVATLNIDLIYGLPGQTPASWAASLRSALAYEPEELYLYPLYVRPLTGLDRSGRAWDDPRTPLYRLGRDLLHAEGYVQVSMRLFRRYVRPDIAPPSAHAGAESRRREASPPPAPVYRCHEDGMVGLGCGARSYTRGLHYASEYAVGARGVREILDDYVARPDHTFDHADFGYPLGPEDQRRRYVIQTLLIRPGLDLDAYAHRFGSPALDDLPQLRELEPLGLAARDGNRLVLTDAGLERSDAIGPWLDSEAVRRAMEGYSWR